VDFNVDSRLKCSNFIIVTEVWKIIHMGTSEIIRIFRLLITIWYSFENISKAASLSQYILISKGNAKHGNYVPVT